MERTIGILLMVVVGLLFTTGFLGGFLVMIIQRRPKKHAPLPRPKGLSGQYRIAEALFYNKHLKETTTQRRPKKHAPLPRPKGLSGQYRIAEALFYNKHLKETTTLLRESGMKQRCPGMAKEYEEAVRQRTSENVSFTGTSGHSYRNTYDLLQAVGNATGITTAIETGTYHGRGTARLSQWAKKVYSIQLSPALFKESQRRFASRIAEGKVVLKNGNSASMLAMIIKEETTAGAQPMFFFLDGHFSADGTALGDVSEGGETPILVELSHILNYPSMMRSAIVIDDARMFTGYDDPKCTSSLSCYPSLHDIFEIVCASQHGDKLSVYLKHDQIVIIPSAFGWKP